MISAKNCRYAGIAYPCNKLHMLHDYRNIMTFAQFTTYSASVVKSNFGNFGGINPFYPLW